MTDPDTARRLFESAGAVVHDLGGVWRVADPKSGGMLEFWPRSGRFYAFGVGFNAPVERVAERIRQGRLYPRRTDARYRRGQCGVCGARVLLFTPSEGERPVMLEVSGIPHGPECQKSKQATNSV